MPKLEITCEDCMDLMARYPDKHFDLAIVDPPYGIDVNSMTLGGASIKIKVKIGITKRRSKNILTNCLELVKTNVFLEQTI